MSEKTTGLFARWTQRRQQVQAEEEAEVLAKQAEAEQAASVDAVAPKPLDGEEAATSSEESPPEKLLTAEDLPDPEKIEVGGSFASFMADNVDPQAKTAALRALWKQPHYNEIDGLLEYALDYTNQPKLSADVSAELAKKVFKHITKDDEGEVAEAQELSADTEVAVDNLETELTSDILDRGESELSQNEPEVQASPKPPVA